jgi:hypothetical protein
MKHLGRMILMLSSDHDGEILAAVRKIKQLLKKDGKDLHWLAERVDKQAAVQAAVNLNEDIGRGTENDDEDLIGMMNFILENGYNIVRKKDFDFVRDLKAQPFHPTAKQIKYLRDLYQKVRRNRS